MPKRTNETSKKAGRKGGSDKGARKKTQNSNNNLRGASKKEPKRVEQYNEIKFIAGEMIRYAVGWTPAKVEDIRFHEPATPEIYVWVLHKQHEKFKHMKSPDKWLAGDKDEWLELVRYGSISIAPWGRVPKPEVLELALRCREKIAEQLKMEQKRNEEEESDGEDEDEDEPEEWINPFHVSFDERAGQSFRWGFADEADRVKFLSRGSPEWWDPPKIQQFLDKLDNLDIWVRRDVPDDFEPEFDIFTFLKQLDQNNDQSVGYFQPQEDQQQHQQQKEQQNIRTAPVESMEDIWDDDKVEDMVESKVKEVLELASKNSDGVEGRSKYIKQLMTRFHSVLDRVEADSLYELDEMEMVETEKMDIDGKDESEVGGGIDAEQSGAVGGNNLDQVEESEDDGKKTGEESDEESDEEDLEEDNSGDEDYNDKNN